MATYNNKHWLLSHIRDSFITTDDTGICEAVMMSDDMPRAYLRNLQRDIDEGVPSSTGGLPVELCHYPGYDEQEEEEEDPDMASSYEIPILGESGLRQRVNTATQQKLEKLTIARRKVANIKTVQFDTDPVPDPEFDKLLEKHNVPPAPANTSSQLTQQMERKPKLPQNKFLEYAKFDGTAQTGMPTRDFRIFVKMLDERQKRYPIQISVIGSATIQQLTGLICYKCLIQHPELQLQSVKYYSIYMVEEDGEIEPDFPPLDPSEPCSKFCFLYLAIAPTASRADSSPTVRMEFPSFSMTSEIQVKADAAINELKELRLQQSEVNREMDLHNTMVEAPLYRSYRVYAKARLKYQVDLGVSGEKIEINPVQPRNSRFWVKQKAASLSIDTVASCELLEIKPNKSTFRILYSNINGSYFGSLDASTSSTGSGLFKHYDFETDDQTAQEIVNKITHILAMSTSNSRRKYMTFCETRKRHQSSMKKKSGNKIF